MTNLYLYENFWMNCEPYRPDCSNAEKHFDDVAKPRVEDTADYLACRMTAKKP